MDAGARRRLYRALRKARWTIRRTGSNHLQIRTPAGRIVAYTGTSPSDQRGWLRLLADLNRAGFPWPQTRARK